MTEQKGLTPRELMLQVAARLETIRSCPGGMCAHCIDILCEDIIPMVNLAVSRPQPAEDERVKEIVALVKQNTGPAFGYTYELREAIRYLLNLLPRPAQLLNQQPLDPKIAKALNEDFGELYEGAAVQPVQTVDLSLLPYEIAEELPKIGGEFGKIAAMCKSHVAAFIEKLISERTVQPAQQDDGWVTFGRIKTDIESETETYERIPVQPAASTEAQDERE